MLIENKILNKVINENSFSQLVNYNITADDFINTRKEYLFIKDFYSTYGELPSYQTMIDEFEGFEYLPEVPDNLQYLCKKLKQETTKVNAYKLIQNEVVKNFAEMDGTTFVNWLYDEVSTLKDLSVLDSNFGTNYATNGAERLSWYLENKERRTFKYIPTPYRTLTKYLGGGFELGDYILIMAYTNRGKSWLGSDVGVRSWKEGFGVLHYSPELSKEQQLQRLDTLNGKFKNSDLKSGNLMDEDRYCRYLNEFNQDQETPYLVKTMGDLNTGLSLDVIEADLQANPNIKMVIIDGFNLMTHKGRGGSNRDNMSNTSRRLRQLFAKFGVVGVVIHQTPTNAEKENRSEDESGARVVTPPRLDQYSETVAVIQDACTILTFDQCDGIGKIKLAKTRTPNVDKEITLQCDFNRGIIKEVSHVDYI